MPPEEEDQNKKTLETSADTDNASSKGKQEGDAVVPAASDGWTNIEPIEVINVPNVREHEVDDPSDQSKAVLPGADDGVPPKDDDAASNVSSSLPPFQFRKFTSESYKLLKEREAEWKRKAAEKKERPSEGRLVDGELVYDEEEGEEPCLQRDQSMVEGNMLPEHLDQDFPKELFNQPIEEIDTLLKDKTFVVIAKRFKKKYIHRFSASKGFFLLAPWHPLRRLAIYIVTSQIFDYAIVMTILVNCVFLALPESNVTDTAEYVFLGIYSAEAAVKLLARGFMLNSYTYLRDAWNWLDLFVIGLAYITYILAGTGNGTILSNISGLRTFRVLRILKTVSIVPGLKTIIGALIKSMRMLAEVILLTLFCMMVFALFALQVYAGILRQKCVKKITPDQPISDFDYAMFIRDSNNWMTDNSGEYQLCGNATGSWLCPTNYTCLPDIGENPGLGYTSFDHFGWAMLSAFQLITLDYWENVYDMIIEANGPSNIIFFGVVVFLGSFYLINLMLAVVSMSYEEEASNAGKLEKEKERKREKRERKERKARERQAKLENNPKATTVTTENEITAGKASGETKAPAEAKTDSQQKKDDKSKTDTNHLQVGLTGNINGSNSASNVSLTSNGHLKTSTLSINESIGQDGDGNQKRDAAMTTVDCGIDSNEKLVDGERPDSTITQGFGHINTMAVLADDDSRSVVSVENEGDAPNVAVRDDDEEELVDRNCQCCGRYCRNYRLWLTIQNGIYKVVADIVFELFISFCILMNVTGMAIEHYQMDKVLEETLGVFNIVFSGVFIVEAILKLIALGPIYFKSAWNVFDLIVVGISIVDIALGPNVEGLGVIRLLRLLRIFKLAQTWSTMRVLIGIIVRTLGALGNLTFVLLIVIYIFAVVGNQLFGKYYTAERFAPDEIPRWNFTDFWHSLILIFRILCGEWIEPLWDCMRVAGELCMIVFLPSLVFGNFVVLNLFLALMLNSFATDSLQKGKKQATNSKMRQGWHRLKGIFKPKSNAIEPQDADNKKPSIADILAEVMRKQKAMYEDNEENTSNKSDHSKTGDGKDPNEVTTNTDNEQVQVGPEKDSKTPPNGMIQTPRTREMSRAFQTERGKFSEFSLTMTASQKLTESTGKSPTPDYIDGEEKGNTVGGKSGSPWASMKGKPEDKKTAKVVKKEKEPDDEENEDADAGIEDCFPQICNSWCPCCEKWQDTGCYQYWRRIRAVAFRITEHKAFEYFILIIIVSSSLALCFEDIYLYQKPTLKAVLYYLNILFAVIFTAEMCLKWISLGFKKYFTSFWTVMDFCIVVIAHVSLAAESLGADQLSSLMALRTLRALRPLRAISRWSGMRIVVNALVYSIPSIFNVLLVCMVFWLIFAIAGNQLFAGKFYRCEDGDSQRISASIVPNRTVCEIMINNGSNFRWYNPPINFDNTIVGFLALLQVATFEGWIEIMRDAVDSRGVDLQPSREANLPAYGFFYGFVIVGSFFSLNLFIGVIIDNFNRLKKKYEGGYLDVFLTSNQKSYYNTMRKLGNRKPQKTIKRPKKKIQGFFFDVAVSTKFELAVVLLILLNMCAMAVEHYHQSESLADALDMINIIFTTIFTLEALVKIIGLRWHYFRRPWNVFDLIIVILSIIGVILDDLLREVFVTPTLLRVVRVFRIGRVLRLVKAAKGIRKLLFALVISMPALFNIGMLLVLIIFIYSIVGMSLFGEVKHRPGINQLTNFETFFSSFVLLFRLTTAAGWNEVLDPMMKTEGCNRTHRTMPDLTVKKTPYGDCSLPTVAALYMVTYIFITYILIINMYIAVILENFSQAHEQEEVGITEDDFEMFYVVWERYDPHATQFIKVEHLSDLVADLDLPLGIPKPNEIALVAFDLPIMQGERLHCLDILISLVKYVLGSVEDSEEFRNLKAQMEEKYREAFPTRVTQVQISSTMRRKKEDVAAKTLQRAWRKHKAQQSIRKITEMAMEAKKDLVKRTSSISGSSLRFGRRLSSLSTPRTRPGSAPSTKNLKDCVTLQRKISNTLTVPTSNDIALASDSDVKV